MTDYRATPEQWADAEENASKPYGSAWQCLLELRARVEALEDANWQQEVQWKLKPPSLKQQALEALNRHQSETWCEEMDADIAVIRRALESLPENP